MKFGLQTLIALVTGSALLCVIVREPQIAFFILLFGLGIPIMLIGLTAPQLGTRLEFEARPLGMPMVKVWIIVLVGVAVLGMLDWLVPTLRYDLGLPRGPKFNSWF